MVIMGTAPEIQVNYEQIDAVAAKFEALSQKLTAVTQLFMRQYEGQMIVCIPCA